MCCEDVGVRAPLLLQQLAWGGRFCQEDLKGCSQVGCSEGVQCYDIPVPGSGATCGACLSGFYKIEQKCSGKYLIILNHIYEIYSYFF